MYKKIIHTIVEEHFDHPVAAEIKSRVDCWTTSTSAQPKVMAINSNMAISFRLAAKTMFSKLHMDMQNYVVSLLDPATPPESATVIQNQLYKTVEGIGDIAQPYYGIAASVAISDALKGFIFAANMYIKELRAGRDVKDLDAAWAKAIDQIASFIGSANEQYWPKETVAKIFTDYKTALIDQATAMIKKDVVATTAAEVLQHDILLGNMTGITGLADVYSSGIIRAFPDKFDY